MLQICPDDARVGLSLPGMGFRRKVGLCPHDFHRSTIAYGFPYFENITSSRERIQVSDNGTERYRTRSPSPPTSTLFNRVLHNEAPKI